MRVGCSNGRSRAALSLSNRLRALLWLLELPQGPQRSPMFLNHVQAGILLP